MYKFLAWATLLLVFLSSCSTESGTGSGSVEPTYSSISRNIFVPQCSCHQTEGNAPFLLTPDDGWANLRLNSIQKSTFLRVSPGDPDNSYLYMKITGDSRIANDRMPKFAAALDDDEIEAIRQWIADGALNN